MLLELLALMGLGVLVAGALSFIIIREVRVAKLQNITVTADTNSFDQKMAAVKKNLDKLPDDILQSLTGSTNTYKGKLGELIGYVNLKAQYDKIIPLGGIVDFVCIRMPKGDLPGYVDFVDIKTGSNARLSKEQRAFRDILKKKLINFKTIHIETIEGLDADENTED